MARPSVPGHGAGDPPGRDARLPGGVSPTPGAPSHPRDARLPAFAGGGAGDRFLPGPWLGMVLDELSGPDQRCVGATDEELIGLLGRWAAMESWAAAAKLGVVRELVRRRARPGYEPRVPGGLPGAWEEGTGHEVSGALAISLRSADNLIDLACALQARLPGIAEMLADGVIDALKAKIICDELSVLDDALAARAEALILPDLAGKTPGEIGKLAAAAVADVDPAGTQKRRERAEKDDARVRLWREHAGTAALAGFGLPTDAALAANANVDQRAREYRQAKLDGTLDQLRVLAFLDILNGVAAPNRIAQARAEAQPGSGQEGATGTDTPSDGTGVDAQPSAGSDLADGNSAMSSEDEPPSGETSEDRPADRGSRNGELDDDGHAPAGRDDIPRVDGTSVGGPGDTSPALAAITNLTIPLATLLGLADRPGQAHGLGPLDPGLARDLAAAAARSPHSTWCITITNPEGHAIGHGCARPARRTRGKAPPVGRTDGRWGFTRRDDPGPPDGYGAWTLTLPGGLELAVQLLPMPVTDCDHRYETYAYQPGDALRHLVQIRDGVCTFPGCSRHARESDFEHAVPYEKGGRTCMCNAGSRSRRCHRVKQSKGWKVTQPRPGWHEWTTPSGRTYVQGPMVYPS